jgi:superfamily I DNA/RNA helicase
MAEVFPILDEFALNQLNSAAEAKFYRACRDTLDDNLLVFHSLSLIIPAAGRQTAVGECDFVIFDRKGGMLIIEVKGGGVRHDPSVSAQWYSVDRNNHEHAIKDPFRQSEDYRHRVLAFIKQKIVHLNNVYFPAGNCVAFPDVSQSQLGGIIAHNRPREIIACSEDLSDLQSWYSKSVAYWNDDPGRPSLGAVGMNEIRRLLLRPVSVRPSLSVLINDEEARRIELTQQQLRLSHCLSQNHKANITGGAGTGKTVMAKYMAERLASEGRRTLLVCYNRGLGDRLRRDTENVDNLEAGSFHSVFQKILGNDFHRYLEEAKSEPSYMGMDEWDVIRPYAYALAISELEFSYDAIVVDEGQDFRSEFWLSLELLLGDEEDKRFYTFADTNQRLFINSETIPDLGQNYFLYANCRNTDQIHEMAYKTYTGPAIAPPAIKGEPVQVAEDMSLADQSLYIGNLLKTLIHQEKVKPEDIIVLAADSLQSDEYFKIVTRDTDNIRILRTETPVENAVGFSTIKKFKGLESAVVVLWGLDSLPEHETPSMSYVGISRAKSVLHLVA